MSLNYTEISGQFLDGQGSPVSGTLTFTPNVTVYASGIPLLQPDVPVQAQITGGELKNLNGGTLQLLATDNAGLSYEGQTGFFFWSVSITVGTDSLDPWQFFLPYDSLGAGPVDLWSLANTAAGGGSYLPLAGGTLTGGLAVGGALSTTPVVLTDAATILVNAAASNYVRVTLGGNRTLGTPSNPTDGQPLLAEVIQPASGGPYTLSYSAAYSFPASAPQPSLSIAAGDHDFIAFTYSASLALWVCTGYVLAQFGALVTIAQGGTGQTTAQAAITALTGVQTSGQYLRSNGTVAALGAIQTGDLPYDSAAADIKLNGTQGAGANAKPADSGHVHPANSIIPADHGLLAWTYDIDSAGQNFVLTAGTIYLTKLYVRYAFTATNLWFSTGTAGVGASNGSFTGLYSSSGSLLSGSADLGSAIFAGNHEQALTTPQALTAGTFVWVAILVNQVTTQPGLKSVYSFASPATQNINLTAANFRIAVPAGGTSQTALLSSFTPSSNTNTGAAPLWFGIS